MKDGENIKQGGIYAATKARLKNMDASEVVEEEVKLMQIFGQFYARILQPALEQEEAIRKRLENIKDLDVTTSYPLLLRFFGEYRGGKLNSTELEKCLGLIEAFVIRRAVSGVATNGLNKLFLQWAKNFPDTDQAKWLHISMSSGGGGRRFPSDAEFAEAFKNQPQYGRGSTRFILCRLERSFQHKEFVDLSSTTIEHILPQTLTPEWRNELGPEPEKVHASLVDTLGNLTLTGYNAELGNLSFSTKKTKLENTHIEMNRWILRQANWHKEEIEKRVGEMLKKANELWPGPITPLLNSTQ